MRCGVIYKRISGHGCRAAGIAIPDKRIPHLFTYILEFSHSLKIGYSNWPARRMKEIEKDYKYSRGESPRLLAYYIEWCCPTYENGNADTSAKEMEKIFLRDFRDGAYYGVDASSSTDYGIGGGESVSLSKKNEVLAQAWLCGWWFYHDPNRLNKCTSAESDKLGAIPDVSTHDFAIRVQSSKIGLEKRRAKLERSLKRAWSILYPPLGIRV